MANIKEYLDNILNAIFGKDVRQSIHDGIKAINEEVAESIETSQNTKNRQDLLEQKYNEQIENIASSEPQNAEIVDARAGFSTLGSIIKQKVFHFENVEAMKNCLTLIPGDVVQTLGYYEENDGGEGLYEIVNDSSLEDDGGSIHELDNGLKAKLIIRNDTVNVKQFGAKGDGTTDDTSAIQKTIEEYNNIIVLPGTFKFTSLTIANNKTIKGLGNNAVLQGKTITITGMKNTLKNIKYDGALDSTGIKIKGNNNIIDGCEFYNIKNVDLGLGYAIDVDLAENIDIKNCYFHDILASDENGVEGTDDIGAVRAIRLYGADYVDISNCKFENIEGFEDGDVIHVGSGGKGETNADFPYNGGKFYTFNKILIHDNYFYCEKIKSFIKTQAGGVQIYNNEFVLNNSSTRHYAMIRVQGGDNITIYSNVFKSIGSYFTYVVLVEASNNAKIKDNSIITENTTQVANSEQAIFKIQSDTNIDVCNNSISTKDTRHIFYVRSVINLNISENKIDGKYTTILPFVLRLLNSYNQRNKNIKFINNNYYEELTLEEISNRMTAIQINESDEIYCNDNIYITDNRGSLFDITNTTKIYIEKEKIKIGDKWLTTNVTYPVQVRANCSDVYVLNNYVNRASSFLRGFATISNLHITANVPEVVGQPTYLLSEQDYSQVHYYPSNYKGINYDYGYSPSPAKFENGHTFFGRTSKKIYVYYDGKWYLDGVEHSFG